MAKNHKCFRCGANGTTREHFPPKSFFPKGANLQLRTVRSCVEHNNGKSQDDQYVLAHICMHAADGENLAWRRFSESIVPQLEGASKFRELLGRDSYIIPGKGRAYKVDIERFDRFFDSLSYAIFFDRYGTSCSDEYKLMHIYLNFESDSDREKEKIEYARQMHAKFFTDWLRMVSIVEADKVDEIVYKYEIIDPGGPNASITIAHGFYGVFQVVSLLTHKAANAAVEEWLRNNDLDREI